MTDRYQVNSAEGEFEPGSNELVLRNLVGIQSADDMSDLEFGQLAQLCDEVLLNNLPDRQLLVQDLKNWHRLWLGTVYARAGQERTVHWVRVDSCLPQRGKSPGCPMNFRPITCRGPGCRRYQSQRASVMCAKRSDGWRSFCSISAVLWPVSTAVELATARITALRLGFLRLGSVALSMVWSGLSEACTLPKFGWFATFQWGTLRRLIDTLVQRDNVALAPALADPLRGAGRAGQNDVNEHITTSASVEVSVFSDTDANLPALEVCGAKFRALKQAMMQELLNGRIRLI